MTHQEDSTHWKSSSVPPVHTSKPKRSDSFDIRRSKDSTSKGRSRTSPARAPHKDLSTSTDDVHFNVSVEDSLVAHQAAKEGDLQALTRILQRPNSVELINTRDQFGSTPLHLCSFNGNKECVQNLLCVSSIEVNCKDLFGRTPIFYAARYGHREILQMLIQRGGDISLKTDAGETAVHKASYYGHLDCLKILFKEKTAIAPLINEGDTKHGNTPLHYASMKGHQACMHFLLDHGALVNTKNATLSTSLHFAVGYRQMDAVKLLLDRQADVNAKDANGRTPIDEAQALGFTEVSTYLSDTFVQAQMEELRKKDCSVWTSKDVAKWIAIAGFPQYKDSFEGNDVTGRSLSTLNLTILKNELAISSYGDRTTILEKIKELKDSYSSKDTNVLTAIERRHFNGEYAGEESDRWRIAFTELTMKELLGKGFFGEVRKAVWNGTDVAVKVIYRDRESSQSDLDTFFKEVNILSKLRHPNVLLFLGACSGDENRCIVTEYMAGGSLYNLIHRNGETLDKNSMLKYKIILDIAKGLAYLHDLPIMHRDLTTKNILLDANMNCKVSDFGLSIALDDKGELTTSLGCLPYQSPEVFRGDVYSYQADVYSFGCIVYELISGSEPHKGLPALKFANMVAYENYRPNIPPCPEKWENLIRSCWSSNPLDRPTFKNILADLTSSELSKFDAPKPKNSEIDDYSNDYVE